MRKPLAVLRLSSGTAALVLSLGAVTAMASSVKATWTVRPGGATNGSGSVQVKDLKTGTIAMCTSLKFGAILKSGSGLPGPGIGSLTSVTHSGCRLATIPITVVTHGLPYSLNATSFSATTGITKGTISGVEFVVTAPGCSVTLAGTTSSSPGTVTVSYTNSKGGLKLLGGGTMHAWNVSGCFGLVNNGDALAFSATTTVTPKQTITSP